MLDAWFQAPIFLLLALALLPLAVWDGVRRWPGARWRQALGVGVRVVGLLALILALAQPRWSRTEPRTDVVFVLDTSSSVGDATLEGALERIEALREALPPNAHAGLVTFDAEPRVIVLPGEPWRLPETLRGPRAERDTDLASALRLAAGLVEEGASGQLVLLSDGRTTRGDVDGALAGLRSRGIPVSTVALATPRERAVLHGAALTNTQLRPGETASGAVLLGAGTTPGRGQLSVRVGDKVALEQTVELAAGEERSVEFQHALDAALPPGTLPVQTTFTVEGGAPLTSTATLVVLPQPAALLIAVDPRDVQALGEALSAEGMRVSVRHPDQLKEVKLDDMDLVVVANVAVEPPEPGDPHLSREFVRELRRYVSDGGGLITLGGDKSYDLGGWGRSEFLRFMPVELSPEDPEVNQAVTMIIILDRSGSMGEWVPGGTKMDLTNKGAVAAMRLLRPFDQIGVMSVDEFVHWRVPVQPAIITPEMERSVRGIFADGGGIYCYTALVAAWNVLRGVDTPLKHVILFSDAADAEEQVRGIEIGWGPGHNSFDLARGMVAEGITVSVIGVGYPYDVDSGFLRKLAEAGTGRFHLTSNANKLQSLFVEETQELLQLMLKEKDFQPSARAAWSPLDGIDLAAAPPLRGYVELKPRKTATVALAGPDDHPIVTHWQYGLGHVVAVATDAGPRWAANWLTWEQYPTLWTQTARWALRHREGDTTGVQVSFEGNGTTLRIARRDQGDTTDAGALRAHIRPAAPADAPWTPIDLDLVEPGLWEARLNLDPDTTWSVGVLTEDGEPLLARAFATPPPQELRYATPDLERLKAIATATHGAPDVASLPDTTPGPAPVSTALWPLFAVAGALLLPFDAFLRRPAREA